jgi:hypothetical protein
MGILLVIIAVLPFGALLCEPRPTAADRLAKGLTELNRRNTDRDEKQADHPSADLRCVVL